MKKVMSLLLALVMALSLLPTAAWAEGNDLTTIEVGGRTVYFATGMENGKLQGGGDVRTGPWGKENIPAFIFYTDAEAGSPCFLAVNKEAFGDTAPTLTYQVVNDADVTFQLSATNTNEADKYVYQLTVLEIPEGGESTYLIDLPRTGGVSDQFAVSFMRPEQGGSQGGEQGGEQGDFEDAGDNVTRYHLEDEGRVCIIEGVNTSIRPDIPVELGIDWRRSLGDVRVIGIPVEIVRALAQTDRNTIVYGRYGIMAELNPAVLMDIAAKLKEIPEGQNNLLWIRADYRNCDAEQGNAYAFRCLLWLGGDDRNVYVTPEGSVLRIGIDNSERLAADGTKFVVYTPNQDDKLTTDNGLTVDYFKRTKAEFSDLHHDYEQFMVNTRSGGVFVVAPEEYKLQMEWPWPGLNGDNDGGDNIGEFQCWTDGKDWNGETDLRYMVIHSLRNMDGGQDVIELGVNWRSREIGDVQNVGITPEVLNEMAEANKPVVLYGAWNVGMTIPAAAVSDMAAKLTAMNQGKSENPALLWLKVEYCNCDGPAGNAYAFCVRAYLGDTHYVLPENLNYTFRLDGQVNNYKAFTLYCPEDQDEVGTALVEQKNDISYTDERDQSSDDSWRVYEFAANHDGMFVIAPVDYSVKQNWPWYGVPLPRWHPSDEAIKPT